MLKDKSHIIKSLCFDIQVSEDAVAVEFADALRKIDVGVLMNNVFKKYDNIKDTIRLDRIQLDFGTIGLDQMNNIGAALSGQIEDILDKVLRRKINLNQLPLTDEEARDEGNVGLQEIKSDEAEIELLIHYLKSGSLPWNTADPPDMEELLLNILKREPAKLKMALVPELGNSIVRRRITIVFSLSTLKILLRKLLGEDEYSLIEKFSALVTEQISVSQKSDFEKKLAAIYFLCVYSSVHEEQNFIAVLIRLLEPLMKLIPAPKLETIHRHIREIIDDISADQQKYFFESADAIIMHIIKTKELIDRKSFESTLNHSSELSEEDVPVDTDKQVLLTGDKTEPPETVKRKDISDAGQDDMTEEQPDEIEEGQYYYPDNAGLVLLNWPMLQRSFEQLGWVKERIIPDERSYNKLLIWMDYLVWGQRKIHEYDLTLNKLLIGMHPSDVADINLALSRHEMKAADEYLHSVIEYWSVLKSTSADGLRSSFLQRNGRLSNEDGGWQMHVESKGIDILIESLPWTFSVIKSPWMNKPLFTQWSTMV